MKWKAEKWVFFMVLSYLKNNKNSRTYPCSNIAKNCVFRTFRLGLLENLTWWSNSEPGFGFYAKNYFGNDYRYFYNNHNLIFCRHVQFFTRFLKIIILTLYSLQILSSPFFRSSTTRVTFAKCSFCKINDLSKRNFSQDKYFNYFLHQDLSSNTV